MINNETNYWQFCETFVEEVTRMGPSELLLSKQPSIVTLSEFEIFMP